MIVYKEEGTHAHSEFPMYTTLHFDTYLLNSSYLSKS